MGRIKKVLLWVSKMRLSMITETKVLTAPILPLELILVPVKVLLVLIFTLINNQSLKKKKNGVNPFWKQRKFRHFQPAST